MEKVLKEFTTDFIARGAYKISVQDLLASDNIVLLDVRTRDEEECMSIAEELQKYPGIEYHNIPMDELPDCLGELTAERPVAALCRTTSRASIVYAYLRTKGFSSVRVVDGGYKELVKTLVEIHGM